MFMKSSNKIAWEGQTCATLVVVLWVVGYIHFGKYIQGLLSFLKPSCSLSALPGHRGLCPVWDQLQGNRRLLLVPHWLHESLLWDVQIHLASWAFRMPHLERMAGQEGWWAGVWSRGLWREPRVGGTCLVQESHPHSQPQNFGRLKTEFSGGKNPPLPQSFISVALESSYSSRPRDPCFPSPSSSQGGVRGWWALQLPLNPPTKASVSPDLTAWGCSNLICYTDYMETITCILETWAGHPDSLTLTW